MIPPRYDNRQIAAAAAEFGLAWSFFADCLRDSGLALFAILCRVLRLYNFTMRVPVCVCYYFVSITISSSDR